MLANKFSKNLIVLSFGLALTGCIFESDKKSETASTGSVPIVTNSEPVITSTEITLVTTGTEYSYTLTATDADDDNLTYSATIIPSWLSFDATTGVLSGTPVDTDAGDHEITLTASDGINNIDQTFTIAVSATVQPNNAPVITSSAVTSVTAVTEYSYTLTATDADNNNTVTLSATTIPNWLTFNTDTGVLSGTPTVAEAGDHPVTLTVHDGTDSVDQHFTVTVNANQIFADAERADWPAWDLGNAAVSITEGGDHGAVANFETIGSIVTGFNGADNGGVFDASSMIAGTISFDLKMTAAPTTPNENVVWKLKLEGTTGSFAKVELSTSHEGHALPVLDTWQTYTFNLSALQAAGQNLSDIDRVLVFPTWGQGDGAKFSLDNIEFSPTGGVVPTEVVIDGGFDNGTTDWSTSNSVGEVIDDAGNKVMAIAVNTADFADVWNLALGQSYSYEANTTYSLSFRAKATVNREIRAGFGITVSPWSASWEPLNITTEWQVYTIERTPDFDASRVFIQMGGVDSTVYIDDMSVTYIDDTPEPVDTDTGAKDTFTLFNGSVDPALAVDSYDPDDNVQVTFEDDNSLHFVKTVTADSDSGNWGIRWPYSSEPTKNGIDLSAWEAEGELVFDLKVNSADDVPLSIRIGNNWPNVSFGYVEPLPALDTWTEVRINIADMIVTGNPNTSEPDDTADISILHTFFIIEPEKGSMDLNFKNIRWEKPTSDTGTDPITD
jgi:hypothetical protein